MTVICLANCIKTRHLALVTCLACGVFAFVPAQAQDADAGGADKSMPDSIELFIGGTFHDHNSEASFGVSYERRLSESFGLGVLAEYTNDREWVFAVPFAWHITEPWKVMVAPGLEHGDGDNTYLTRVGTSYEFKFNGWSLAPELNFDFSDGEVKTVAGVSFGWEFR
jgi:hypothetical protein